MHTPTDTSASASQQKTRTPPNKYHTYEHTREHKHTDAQVHAPALLVAPAVNKGEGGSGGGATSSVPSAGTSLSPPASGWGGGGAGAATAADGGTAALANAPAAVAGETSSPVPAPHAARAVRAALAMSSTMQRQCAKSTNLLEHWASCGAGVARGSQTRGAGCGGGGGGEGTRSRQLGEHVATRGARTPHTTAARQVRPRACATPHAKRNSWVDRAPHVA